MAQASFKNKDRVDAGTYKEVGGWVLISPNGQEYEAYIKPSEAAPHYDFDHASRKNVLIQGDNATQVMLNDPGKSPGVAKRLDQGWFVVGEFHSHIDNLESPGNDQNRAHERQIPGLWIFPDGSTKGYGPDRGLWGIGVPKRCQ